MDRVRIDLQQIKSGKTLAVLNIIKFLFENPSSYRQASQNRFSKHLLLWNKVYTFASKHCWTSCLSCAPARHTSVFVISAQGLACLWVGVRFRSNHFNPPAPLQLANQNSLSPFVTKRLLVRRSFWKDSRRATGITQGYGLMAVQFVFFFAFFFTSSSFRPECIKKHET